MNFFELRGREIDVQTAPVFESSLWDASPTGTIPDTRLIIQGVVLAKRHRSSRRQEAYAYIDEDLRSARGIWLQNSATLFRVVES